MTILLGIAAHFLPTSWAFTDLGEDYYALGINSDSTPVIAGFNLSSGTYEGCYWDGSATATLVSGSEWFVSVNNTGSTDTASPELVGTGSGEPVRYSVKNSALYSFTNTGSSSYGTGINEYGRIAGYGNEAERVFGAQDATHMALVDAQSTVFTKLLLISGSGPGDEGNNINSSGVITGLVSNSDPMFSSDNGFFTQAWS